MIPFNVVHKFNYKKLAVLAFTPILAVCLLSSPALASKKKKKKKADDTTATQTQPASTDQTSTSTKKKPKTKKTEDTAATQTQSARTTATPANVKETTTTTASKPAKKATRETTTAASSSEIANAKSKGMVWVNTDSKIYHKSGKYYGNTKQGKFMSESDAQKAGYKASKN